MVRTTKRTDAQRRRRRQQLRTRQGPMFPGNREAQTARNDTLERVMSIIDSKEENGRLPRGIIQEVVEQQRQVYPWLTRYQIDGLRKRRSAELRRAKQDNEVDVEEEGDQFFLRNVEGDKLFLQNNSEDSDDNDSDDDIIEQQTFLEETVADDATFAYSVGRKKGSTDKAKMEMKNRQQLLIDDISDTWRRISQSASDRTQLFEIIIMKKTEHRLEDLYIPETTVISRVRRGNTNQVQRGNTSPMSKVEPTLCHLLKYAARMGQGVSQQNVIDMANELIKDKVIGAEVAAWKLRYNAATLQKFNHDKLDVSETVGWGWFRGFRNRYKEITSRYVHNIKHYRDTWSTWTMLFTMYTLIYAKFVSWGHAVEMDAPEWQDAEGNKVHKEMALGHPVKYKLLHPDLCLSMDETGDNGNQSDDKATQAYKVMCETNGPRPVVASATNDTTWTTQGFTSLSGKAVLAVVIIKKSGKLNFNEKNGFDFEAEWQGDESLLGELPSQDQMDANKGPNLRYPGLVSCVFNGITIPGLVLASDSGGVTPEILVECLQHLDKLNVFPRDIGLPSPALLVDGHGSRLAPCFVQYCNNLKDDFSLDPTANHYWNCALGLPNSTGFWQIGDSPEENSAFKFHSRVKKDSIREDQTKHEETPHIKTYNIVPIVNYAFQRSFMVEKGVRKAVADRGWFPLNMNCLNHPDILRTKVAVLQPQENSEDDEDNEDNEDNEPASQLSDLTETAVDFPIPAVAAATVTAAAAATSYNLSVADVRVINQGPDEINNFNWSGDVTRQVFRNCVQKMNRYKGQDEAVKKQRAKVREASMSQLEILGRLTSGKCYNHDICSINDPDFIYNLKLRQEKKERLNYDKECKEYIRERNRCMKKVNFFCSDYSQSIQTNDLQIEN